MSKNMIYGAGVLGIIAAAIYIYKEHKKAKEAEQESVVNVDSEAEAEEQIKEQKKEVVTDKVSSLGRKIGKTFGTAALKFGAKHPKITKFILKFGRYIPYVLIGVAVINSFAIKWKVSHWNDAIDGSDMIYEGDITDERFDAPLGMVVRDADPQKTYEFWRDTNLSSNYQKLQEFLRTLDLAYSEHYEIDNKDFFTNSHPEYDTSDVNEKFVLQQRFSMQDILDHQQQP